MADKQVRMVDLFYLGGFVKENATVTAMGNSYTVPPVGESLRVPDYIARRLVKRNRNPQGVSVFTADKGIAKAVMNMRNNPPAPVTPKEHSVEELREMLMAAEAALADENKPVRKAKAEKESEAA